ncbi:MAG: GGDEF domain-containing protein [Nitrospirae bacterium]|nr:GGDEF domain-containing protein [Nitrospirota bacterium]
MNHLVFEKKYLDSFHEIEKYYELSIRGFSALVKLCRLDEKTKDTGQLCGEILQIFTQELEFENTSIMLRDENNCLTLAAGKGKGDKYFALEKNDSKRKIRIGEGVAGKVAKTGEYIYIPDAAKDKRFKTIGDMKVKVASLLTVPLKSDNKVIGVINFSHPLPHAYNENTINMLSIMGNFVGQIITMTELYNKTTGLNKALERKVQETTIELEKRNKKLQKSAITDPLTGLYNRRFFFKRLEEEFARAKRYKEHFSLLLFDIDNLKPVNDTYGHAAGDKVIKATAKLLKETGRESDIAGRLGGDEFGYIMLVACVEDAFVLASRIQKKFSEEPFDNMDIKPTLSVGIASTTLGLNNFKNYHQFFESTDGTLYDAKKEKDSICLY